MAKAKANLRHSELGIRSRSGRKKCYSYFTDPRIKPPVGNDLWIRPEELFGVVIVDFVENGGQFAVAGGTERDGGSEVGRSGRPAW